ncbi:MAG: phospholipase D family protein [Lachnospiraceae bacterium]
MKNKLLRRLPPVLLLCIVLFLIIGAIAPFVISKKISTETKEAIKLGKIGGETSYKERVMLLESNSDALKERMRLLNRAKSEIILSTFDMREGKSTKDLFSVILNKADAGVKVRILVDGLAGTIRMQGRPFFYALSSHPNIEIKLYNPINLAAPWKSQGRMHDKYIIVDQEAYILGGRNTFDYFLGDYGKKSQSFDREVLIYNGKTIEEQTSLTALRNYFNGVWQKKDCKLFHNDADLAQNKEVTEVIKELNTHYKECKKREPEIFAAYSYPDHTQEAEAVRLLSNPTGIYAKEPIVFYQLVELMKSAKESVVIHTPYMVCNSTMYDGLETVANKVPNTKIVVNSIENGDNFCASSDYIWNRKGIIGTGAQLLEYDGGTSLHGKSILIDEDTSVIGSYNFDMRSTYVDTELMLVIKSRELNAQLGEKMDELEKDSKRVMENGDIQVPEHLHIKKLPLYKEWAMRVFGLILQGFRYLV